MKKTLIALAALAATGAFAQSTVTLFGVVDATVAVGNGDVANKTQLTNSGYNSSRLGFKGVEDLGGGMQAGFWLEAGVNNDNGTGSATNVNNQTAGGAAAGMNGSQGLTFNRRSTVSLIGNFGEFRLGRDYTPNFWNLTMYDPFGTNGVGTTRALTGAGAIAGNVMSVRASNTIAYLSPTMGGFAAWGQLAMGENLSNLAGGADTVGNGAAIRVTYDMGPLSLGVAFNKTTIGANNDLSTTNIGGSYDMKVAKLMAFYQKDSASIAGSTDVTGYTLGALIPAGPGTARVSFANTDNGNSVKTNQFSLGYVYDMSKRTSLYGTFASVNNSGGASAALNGAVTTVNGSSNGYDLGIKHSF